MSAATLAHSRRPREPQERATTATSTLASAAPQRPPSCAASGLLRHAKKRKREAPASPITSSKTTLTIGVDMPLREPAPPLAFAAMSVTIPSPAPSPAADAMAPTILDQCLQLPKLNLGSSSARSSAPRHKLLPLIEPLKYPFHARPRWCLNADAHTKPRAVTLLDAYKDHELVTTVRFSSGRGELELLGEF